MLWDVDVNAAAWVDFFPNEGSSEHMYQRPKSNWLFVTINYLFSVAISASCLLVLAIIDCVFSILARNLRQTGTILNPQHAVNVNEICTKALPGSCCFRVRIIMFQRPRKWTGDTLLSSAGPSRNPVLSPNQSRVTTLVSPLIHRLLVKFNWWCLALTLLELERIVLRPLVMPFAPMTRGQSPEFLVPPWTWFERSYRSRGIKILTHAARHSKQPARPTPGRVPPIP